MSKYICIILAALMVAGCSRSEVREARRERAPLREVFPPPSVDPERTATAAPQAPEPGVPAGDADAASPSKAGAASLSAPALDERPSAGAAAPVAPAALPGLENEFIEARAAVEEAQQAAAETAAEDVAAAAATAAEAAPATGSTSGAEVVEDDTAAALERAAGLVDATPAARTQIGETPPGAQIQPIPGGDVRTPLRIVVSTRPAILVPLYGKPRLVNVPGTALTRIENTPAIVLKGKSGNYYVPVYDGFMQSKQLDGTWTVTKPIPNVLNTGKAEAIKAGQQDLFVARPNPRTGRIPSLAEGAPRVIVSSQPTALVLVDGQPGYQRVEGTQLSRLVNSDAVMFRNAADERLYLQVGDGWYRASLTGGPWSPVPEGELPAEIGPALEISRAAR